MKFSIDFNRCDLCGKVGLVRKTNYTDALCLHCHQAIVKESLTAIKELEEITKVEEREVE